MPNQSFSLGIPLNFNQWIDEHRHLLKPPVGNQVVWKDREFIIMVVGGPNIRKDYHHNQGEEFFYQLEGDMVLKVKSENGFEDIPIKEGEIYLLPPRVPHSPQRFENTIGLVVERQRREGELDGFSWYCEECGEQLYREDLQLKDIVGQLPKVFDRFFGSAENTTCDKCGAKMKR